MRRRVNILLDRTIDPKFVPNEFIQAWGHNDEFSEKFLPLNGPWEDCYYDYHAPLYKVLEENGYEASFKTQKEMFQSSERFVYVLTFRLLTATVFNEIGYNFFKQISHGTVEAINSGKVCLVINDAHESAIYNADFFILFNKMIDEVRLNRQHIIMLTSNFANRQFFNNSIVNFFVWEFFETSMRIKNQNVARPSRGQFEEKSMKRFLCLNRIPREHRYYFMFEMYKRNLLKHFNCSLKDIDSLAEIHSHIGHLLLNKIKDDPIFQKMTQELPFVYDTDAFEYNHWSNIDDRFNQDNGIFIVSETLFLDGINNLFLTEKTFKPISLRMPFIVLGNAHALRQLHSHGYMTFHSLWDESYDEEMDPYLRMEKIVSLVQFLADLPAKEFELIYKKSMTITEHNFRLLMSRRPESEVVSHLITNYSNEV